MYQNFTPTPQINNYNNLPWFSRRPPIHFILVFLEMTPYKFCILWKWPFTQFPIAKFTTHLIYSRVLLFTAVTSNFNSRPLLHALTKTNQYFENDPQENLVGVLSIVLSPDNVIATSKRCTKILAVIFILKRIIVIIRFLLTPFPFEPNRTLQQLFDKKSTMLQWW